MEWTGIEMSSAHICYPAEIRKLALLGTLVPAAVRQSSAGYSTLAHQFRLIRSDRDGTAVASQLEDASTWAHLAEPLLANGCWLVVVVTGTSFEHIAPQFGDRVSPPRAASASTCVPIAARRSSASMSVARPCCASAEPRHQKRIGC